MSRDGRVATDFCLESVWRLLVDLFFLSRCLLVKAKVPNGGRD